MPAHAAIRPFAIGLLAAAGLLAAVPVRAENISAMGCGQLWHQRNAILKAHGFCFRDPRAARVFGNAGCSVYDAAAIRLTPAERRRLDLIVISEKSKLCR